MIQQVDALIVGAGVVGCSIALALSRRGISALAVDPLPAPGYGSTSHSSAIVRPIYSHVTSCAVAHEARSSWLDWRGFLALEDDEDAARYTECGGIVLMMAGEEAAFEANLAAMAEVGVAVDMLSVTDIEALYPGIATDGFGPPRRADEAGFAEPAGGRLAGGFHVAAAGYVSDPQLAARNLHDTAVRRGARFRFGDGVTRFTNAGDRITGACLASGLTVAAGVVINAAGPHSSKINDLAGVSGSMRMTTTAQRHEVVYVRGDAPHFAGPGKFLVDLDSGYYLRPDGADLVIGSADPACDDPVIVDPDAPDPGFTAQWTTQLMRAAQRFPDLPVPNTARGTVGLYDVSDDWIPIYDRSDLEGFYLAIGTSGNQFKNAPLIGEILASIIECGAAHDAHAATLHLPNVGRTIDLGFYSRLREIRETSSVLA